MDSVTPSVELIARNSAILVAAAAATALLGWALDIGALKSILPQWPAMKPLTAAGLMLASIALALLRPETASSRRRMAGRWAAALATLIGVLTVLEYLTGRNLGIDALLFPDALQSEAPRSRMALNTAASLTLVGFALLLLDFRSKSGYRPAQILAPVVILLSLLALLGYVYGVESLLSMGAYPSMAVTSILSFLALSAGLLAARAQDGWIGLISGSGAGGVMARKLLPAVVIVPIALGWLRWKGQQAGWYDTQFGLALFTSANILVFAALTLWAARELHDLDVRRKEAAATRVRDLIESTPDAMVIADSTGRIVQANSQAHRLFGYQPGELGGHFVELLLPERSRGIHTSHRADYFAQPRTRAMGQGLELYGLRKDRTEFPVEIALSPITDEDGTTVISAIRDITERKRHEQMLLEKNIELARASQAKDRFLASMSHELRTPLNAVIGFTGTLLMKLPGPLNAEQEKQLKTVQTAARHLLSLINDLLDLAKIEAGKVSLLLEPTDCCAVLAEIAATLRPQALDKGLDFVLSIPPTQVMVRTDRRALSQIVLNLVNNAIKFTDSGSVRIEITRQAAEPAGAVEIAVIDTGMGIRPEDQARLFSAFTQARTTQKNGAEGTGLGLHLSRKLAELLGGSLQLHSKFGRGSTFTVRLKEG